MDGLDRRTCRASLAAACLIGLVCGCAPTRNALPRHLAEVARIPAMPAMIRDWGDAPSARLQTDLVDAFSQHQLGRGIDILALSGGGADGAYGAGLLVGWTQTGTRPVFTIVTGVSTGALMAPFVFAGPAYDDPLRRLYTTVSDDDLFRPRNLAVLAAGTDSLADTAPLGRLLDEYVDDGLIEAIADAHRSGRRLYVATTQLDAQRMMVWNMGAVAAVGDEQAKRLFRQILLASASIPVAFPPAYIEVEARGATYDEMHSDGGGTAQILYPGFLVDVNAAAAAAGWDDSPAIRLHVIQTVQLSGAWRHTRPDVLAIAERLLSTLLYTQGRGDLARIHAAAVAAGMQPRWASFPEDFTRKGSKTFDPIDMARLFELGAKAAMAEDTWQPTPPARAQAGR